MNKSFKKLAWSSVARYGFGVLAISLLAACSSSPALPTVGSAPAATPPRIVNDPANSAQRVWDDPSAFGPVPDSLAAKGQATCGALNTKETQYKAIGYHPKAQNYEGKTLAQGGYFCVPK